MTTNSPSDQIGKEDQSSSFAERSWHTCWSCRYDEGRGVNGSPPWHECTVFPPPSHHRFDTNEGRTCNRYSPLPWAVEPAASIGRTTE